MRFSKVWNLKAFILAFQIAFMSCFFIGIFHNYTRIEKFTSDSWYYINRGYPIPWAGVSKSSLSLDFPIIKAPFLTREFYGNTHTKIIDLAIFLPLFIIVLIAAYPIGFILSKAVEENKFLNIIILIPSYILLTLGCIFFYFFWFPRI